MTNATQVPATEVRPQGGGACRSGAESLLSAVVEASHRLVLETDLARGVSGAVEALRLHAGLDRVYVFRYFPGLGGARLIAESSAGHVASIAQMFGDRHFSESDFPEVFAPLRVGRTYQSVHRERSGANAEANEAAQSRSDLMVPVFVAGRFWGMVGVDDCRDERRWSPSEVQALEGAAAAIAAAVARDGATRAQAQNAAALALRDRLLAAVALSLHTLLGSNDDGFDAAVNESLGALGTACGIHRVKVILERPAPDGGELTHYLDHEWWAPGLSSQASLGLTEFPSASITPWTEQLRAGRAIWYLIDDVPIELRAAFARVGVRSVGAVPIFGGARYLGCVAFDDCVEKRVWSDAEIDALGSAARTIGGAIHRHELTAATAQVNRLLQGVVAASRVLLEDDNFETAMPRWLQHLGVAMEADRALFGGFTASSNPEAVAQHHFEWLRAGMTSVAGRVVPSSSDFDGWSERLRKGEAVWAHREDLRDPVSVRFWAETNVATNFIVPVVVDRETVAWLCGDFRARREWSNAIGSVLRTAADGAAAALKRRKSMLAMLAERDRRIESEQRRADQASRHGQRLERHARVLAAMAQSAQDMLAADDPQDCVVAVLARVGEATGALRGGVTRFDWTPDDPEMLGWQEVTHEWTRPGAVRQMDTALQRFAMRRDDASYDLLQRQFDESGRIIVKVEEQAEPYRSEQLGLGVTWVLGVPFVLEGEIAGSFGFDFDEPFEEFHEPDLAAIVTLASTYANGLLRARFQQRALAAERDRANEEARLATLLRYVVQSSRKLIDVEPSGFEPALLTWLESLGRAAAASRATLYDIVTHAASGMRTARMLCEWSSHAISGSLAVSFDRPHIIDPRGAESLMAGLLSGQVVVVQTDDTDSAMREFLKAQGNATVVAVPIFRAGVQWGCLSFDYALRQEADSGDVAILLTAADTLAAVLNRNEAIEVMLAERDWRIAAETARAREAARHALRTERHSALLSAVAISAEELLATREPAQCLDRVLTRIGATTKAQRACVARIDWLPGDPVLHGWQEIVHEWVAEGSVSQMAGESRRFPMRRDDSTWEHALAQFAAERRIVAVIADQDEPFRSEQMALGVAWSLCYPILLEGEIWGLLGFDYANAFDEYEEADLSALQTVASTIADALARERLEQRSLDFERARADENERLVAMLELVVRSSRALVDADDFEPALRTWLGAFGRATGASRASFGDLVVHEPSGLPTIRTLCEWVEEGVEGSIALSFDDPFVIDPRGASEAAIRLETGRAHVLHIEDTAPPMRDLLAQQGNQTVITVPIFLSGKQWGCLAFDHAARTELDSRDAAILQTAADTLAAILKRNEAARNAIAEREARIGVEQRRFSELAHANDALRISLDALADTEGEDSFFKQSLLQIRAQSGACAAYLFSSDRTETTLRLIGCVTDGRFNRVGRPDDPAMFRDGFTMVPALLAQLKGHGRLLWRRVDAVTAVDDNTPESTRWHLRLGHKANALHALMVGGRQVGLIGLIFDSETPPTEAQQELVHTLCQPLTLALELARLSTQARLTAEHAAVRAERDRMAAEIHDSLAQSFTSIAMQSESLAGRLADDDHSAKVLRLIERTAREGLSEARASVLALAPLDAAPGALDQALAQLVERSSVQGGIECRFESDGTPCDLPGAVRESLLRIAQEATSNAMRHSGGSSIRIVLQYLNHRVLLNIEDDGRGLPHDVAPKQNGGFGLTGMESRAATVGATVSFGRSSMGGTLVAVEVPCGGSEGLVP